MSPPIAIVREPGPSLDGAIRTHVEPAAIDAEGARRQHAAYVGALASLGCEIVRLPSAPELPDAVFVEDAAVVLDEVAIACRPGAAARRAEVPSVIEAVRRWRPVEAVHAPATVDGGDVLVVGRTVFVGRSDRTNGVGAAWLRELLEPRGYRVVSIEVRGCLHLKTAVTSVADGTVLAHRPWIDAAALEGVEILDVDPSEPFAANALRVGDVLLVARRFPRTAARLTAAGLDVRPVAADELAKAEGGLTCSSVIFGGPTSPTRS